MLKLGILICDHLHPSLQSEHGDYPKMFDDLFRPFDNNIVIQYYFVVDGNFPKLIHDCDAYMTSGSKSSVNDKVSWIVSLEDFIRDLYREKIPFVGICFGHQLMAKALGGQVEKSHKGWGVGVHSSDIKESQPWMKTQLNSIDLVVSHQDQISQLPIHTKVIASSEFCPYSMIQIGDHFLGIQGHPEFSREYSSALMDLRREIIPQGIRDKGKATLTKNTSSDIVAHWMIDFIRLNIK